MDLIFIFSTVFAAWIVRYLVFNFSRNHRCFPPGPSTWPMVGNILKLPSGAAWYTFLEWKREY
ncbi:hypothetical protein C8F04DRAFT_913181, partial [Mycena alexandri]